MLWAINNTPNLQGVISLLRHPKPIYIPLIIVIAPISSVSTNTLIENILTLEKLQGLIEWQRLN